MDYTAHRIPYRQTESFTKIVMDYIDQNDRLKPFFAHAPSLQGIAQSIEQRKLFSTDRTALVSVLEQQYAGYPVPAKLKENIRSLLSQETFTVTTAHQPNLFTGPLYFLYKILHVIKLADHFNQSFPGQHFVPVYYMGSEDADFDELGHCWLQNEKLSWSTSQKGAFGKMTIDKSLLSLLDKAEGMLGVLPYGKEIVSIVKSCYQEGKLVQEATMQLVNILFGEYGLIVLIADHPLFKKQVLPIFRDDLLQQQPSLLLQQTNEQLDQLYKVQAQPRDINLFYLEDQLRGRIEKVNDSYFVHDSEKRFSETEIIGELEQHPEKFSPNVILRGIFQETILPNIAFVGGGGELAYWLQLKDLFQFYKVPYPVLVLRNSFLLVEKKWKEKMHKLSLQPDDLFLPAQQLIENLVRKNSNNHLTLNGTLSDTEKLYLVIKEQAARIDVSLASHVENLKVKALQRLQQLEKKMLRAEKRKFTDQQRQIQRLKNALFPGNGLQERYDNFMYYYALWGKSFISILYDESLALENEFVTLLEKEQ